MQVYEKSTTNTKTFPQIWETLTPGEKDDLCIKFYQRKCAKSRQGVWFWAKGMRKPQNPLVRDTIADIVSKFIGEKCFADTLFPRS